MIGACSLDNFVTHCEHRFEVGARGYINVKWHHMMRALKLDKRMNKRLKNAVSDVAVRCSYFLYVCLRRREWCTTKLLG